ncbi:MAG: hypothetical protein OEZ06_10870 [Myxococcales bacterium]|nr:hypothetical protein [Myxococcales bacterium]
MSNGPPDNSYDLREASTLSARLRRATSESGAAPADGPPDAGKAYVRFSAAGLAPATAPAAAPAEAAVTAEAPKLGVHNGTASEPQEQGGAFLWEEAMRGPSGWAYLLERVRSKFELRAAFVVDPQGLLVACKGSLPGEGAESAGARLAIAFEHADRIAPEGSLSQSLAIELGGTWLTGLRVTVVEVPRLVVGLYGETPLSKSALHTLSKIFVRKAAGA